MSSKPPQLEGETEIPHDSVQERLVSELLTARNLARKTRVKDAFDQANLEMLGYAYFTTRNEKRALLEHWGIEDKSLQDKIMKNDETGVAFSWLMSNKNAAISEHGMGRIEYTTAVTGVNEQNAENNRSKRLLEGIF